MFIFFFWFSSLFAINDRLVWEKIMWFFVSSNKDKDREIVIGFGKLCAN